MNRECLECDQPIPPGRLRVKPSARFCIHCQEDLEKRGLYERSVMDIQPEIQSWENIGVTQTLIRGTE